MDRFLYKHRIKTSTLKIIGMQIGNSVMDVQAEVKYEQWEMEVPENQQSNLHSSEFNIKLDIVFL